MASKLTINDQLLPIFVISLKRSDERRKRISEQFHSIGLSFYFFDAVDGASLGESDLQNVYNETKALSIINRRLSRPEIGCALSHQALYRLMNEMNIERAIIIEDDVFFDDSFKSIYRWLSINPLPDDVLLFFKGLQPPDPPWWLVTSLFNRVRVNSNVQSRKIVSITSHIRGTCCYYLSSKIAGRLNSINHPLVCSDADNWKYFYKENCFREMRVIIPDVIHHPEGKDRHSYIEEGRSTSHKMSSPNSLKQMIKTRCRSFFFALRFCFHLCRQIFRLCP